MVKFDQITREPEQVKAFRDTLARRYSLLSDLPARPAGLLLGFAN